MKKLLVVALSVVMVLSFAAFAMADATVTWVGNVNAEYNTIDAINNGYGDVWGYVAFTKDFTNGWTGGLNFKIVPGKTSEQVVPVVDPVTGLPVDADGDGVNDTVKIKYQNGDAIAFDGDGFIKYTADMYNVTFKTGGSFGVGADLNAPDAAGGQISGPNVQVGVTPMEGLTASLYLTDTGAVTKQTYDIGVQGVYDLNGLKVGLGYSMATGGTTESDNDVTTMGVFGSYKLMEDALTVGAEYQSRTYPDPITDPAVGMKVYANYSKDALSAGISYITRTAMFYTKNDKSTELWSLPDRFMDVILLADPAQTEAWESLTDTMYLLSLNASYQVTEAVKAGVNVDMTDAKYQGTASDGSELKDVSAGYKIYVTDQIVPDLSLEAGYQSFLDSKVYVKLSAKIN